MPAAKNILLINPWIYDFTAYDFWMKPLGLLSIAAVLEPCGSFRLDFIDCLDRAHPGLKIPFRSKSDGRGSLPKEEVSKPAVLKGIPRRYSRYGIPISLFRDALNAVPMPDLVLMTCTMTYWYPGVQTAVEEVRRKFGGVPVVLGGVYPTLMPGHAASASGADIVVQGSGENKIPSLITDILGDELRVAGEFAGLDDLPPPAYGLLRDKTWLPLLTSRGCPFRCSFCAGPLLHDRFEQRAPSGVVNEIERCRSMFGTRHFAFYDDALFVNKACHLSLILQDVWERGLNVSFHTPNGVHVREIDEEFARLLRRAGVRSLYLSQESTDEKLLAERTPKVGTEDLGKALDCLEDAGYARNEISVYLIAGLPGQNAESVRSAIQKVKEMNAVPRLAYFSPIPGTLEWRHLVGRGIMAADEDPLLHNKIAFSYLRGEINPDEWAGLRKLVDCPGLKRSKEGR